MQAFPYSNGELQNLFCYFLNSLYKIKGNIKVVISNKEDAFGLERAKKHNIRAVFEKNEDEVIKILKEENVDLVVLAGYLKIISPKFVSEFRNKMM